MSLFLIILCLSKTITKEIQKGSSLYRATPQASSHTSSSKPHPLCTVTVCGGLHVALAYQAYQELYCRASCRLATLTVCNMIDIATWRARIGLYRVRAGPSGRRAKVLLPLASDGAADWSLLSTITVEQVVTVIYAVVITVLLVLSGDIGRYYCLHLPAASIMHETGE